MGCPSPGARDAASGRVAQPNFPQRRRIGHQRVGLEVCGERHLRQPGNGHSGKHVSTTARGTAIAYLHRDGKPCSALSCVRSGDYAHACGLPSSWHGRLRQGGPGWCGRTADGCQNRRQCNQPGIERREKQAGAGNRRSSHPFGNSSKERRIVISHRTTCRTALAASLLTTVFSLPARQENGSVKNLGHYAASWSAWWPKRPSSTAALT